MVSILPLPDWVPAWVHAAILCSGALLALAFLFLPFAVFGTKGRLEAIEARLDEIQGEIRSLSLRLREPLSTADDEEAAYPAARPPIPPAPRLPAMPGRATSPADLPPVQRSAKRTEPRLY